MPTVLTPRWTSVFIRWHLRHAAMVAVGTRIALTLALAWLQIGGKGPPDFSVFHGPDIAIVAVVLATVVATLDRRRLGANELMANLGYSRSVQAAMTAIPAILLETAISVTARVT